MDNTREEWKKLKRPKSVTRYPKRTNTYVVAFAVQEPSLEDASKTIIASKRSTENGITSNEPISVTGSATSTKTFTISPTNDLCHPQTAPTISEVKIDMIDGNQCGDTEKSPQTTNYQEVANKMVDEQPQIIFNASKNMKRCKEHHQSLRKKPKSYRRVIKFKSIHFKYKNSKNVITRRVEKCCVKSKLNASNSGQLKKIYSNTISKVISRTRILKNVLAKENLLAGAEPLWMSENDTGSLKSGIYFPSSMSSNYGSQKTLVNDSSFSLKSDDLCSIKTVNSVVPLSTNTTPYNTDVNIAVAVAFTPIKPNHDHVNYTIPSTEEFSDKGNVTSTESMAFSGMELTSQLTSDDSTNKAYPKDFVLNEKDVSSVTLAGLDITPLNLVSDDDTLGGATSESDKSDNGETHAIEKSSDRVTLLDTVMHLGFYPEMTPSTSSGANFENSLDDITVKNNLLKCYLPNPNKESLAIQNQLSKNVCKKSFDVECTAIHNNISLPDEAAIKTVLENSDKKQKKIGAEEIKDNNVSLDMIEIWNRLSLILDLAVKRLEETLTEKIIREIKTTLSGIIMSNKSKIPKLDQSFFKGQEIKSKRSAVKMTYEDVFDDEKITNDQSHQCDLVQNQIIDQLMLKLSVEGPKMLTSPQVSLKSLKSPKVISDYLDILKRPVNICDAEVGKGDTVTVSTTTRQRSTKKYRNLQRFRALFSSPASFLRENLLVITSVPTFFLILFCLYGIIALVVKPW